MLVCKECVGFMQCEFPFSDRSLNPSPIGFVGLLRGQGSLGELESVHQDKNLQDWDMEPSCTETANKPEKKKKKQGRPIL